MTLFTPYLIILLAHTVTVHPLLDGSLASIQGSLRLEKHEGQHGVPVQNRQHAAL